MKALWTVLHNVSDLTLLQLKGHLLPVTLWRLSEVRPHNFTTKPDEGAFQREDACPQSWRISGPLGPLVAENRQLTCQLTSGPEHPPCFPFQQHKLAQSIRWNLPLVDSTYNDLGKCIILRVKCGGAEKAKATRGRWGKGGGGSEKRLKIYFGGWSQLLISSSITTRRALKFVALVENV